MVQTHRAEIIGADRSLSNLVDVAINTPHIFDPGGDMDVELIHVGVTGIPKLQWNETADSFEFTHDLLLPGGSISAIALAAIQTEATLEFQQPTTISTKAGAGVLTLESVGNSLILQAGTDIRLKDDVLLFDNKKLWMGTTKDYWFDYSTSGSRLRLMSRDIDGIQTEGAVFRVLDGTDDVQFIGGIQVDTIDEFTAGVGVDIEGTVFEDGDAYDILLSKSKAGPLISRIYNSDSVDGIGMMTVGASGGGVINLIANSDALDYKGIPPATCGIAVDYGGEMIFAVGDSGSATEQMRLTEDGFLGLGGTAPLDNEQLLIQAEGMVKILLRDNAGGVQTQLTQIGSGDFLISRTGTGATDFAIQPDGDVILALAGNVGIGTATPGAELDVAGSIILTGTVDGRDVATDGTKLDGIAAGAIANLVEDTSPQLYADLDCQSKKVVNMNDPTAAKNAVNLQYFDANLTKQFFIGAGAAILSSNASYPTPNDTFHLALADGVTFARCFFVFQVPGDFTAMASGYPKVRFKQGTGGTGNYRIAFNARAGGVGEQMGAALDSIAEYTMNAPGVSDELWDEDVSAAFDGLGLAAGDSVGLQIQRDSDDGLDSFSGDLDVVGVNVKYT